MDDPAFRYPVDPSGRENVARVPIGAIISDQATPESVDVRRSLLRSIKMVNGIKSTAATLVRIVMTLCVIFCFAGLARDFDSSIFIW
jgi:hypothetical protein